MAEPTNPFDTSNDLNPFAQVDVYNPFESPKLDPVPTPFDTRSNSSTTSSPALPTSSSLSRSSHVISSPTTSPTTQTPELKFRATEYEQVENFYRDETGVLLDGGAGGPTDDSLPPLPSTASASSRGMRVTVQRTTKEEEDLNFWNLDFYRRFFNVDTMDVFHRCLRSLWPFKCDFLPTIKNNPDLYGPFWISTTLIFMLAASANFAFYIESQIETGEKWTYDLYKLTYGSAVIYCYAFGVPLLFWLYIKYIEISITLLEIVCIYGYSLFVFSPVTLLCIIPLSLAKWLAVGFGFLFSTSFLVVNLWLPLREKVGHAIILLVVMTLFHLGLALTFRLYFFQYGSSKIV